MVTLLLNCCYDDTRRSPQTVCFKTKPFMGSVSAGGQKRLSISSFAKRLATVDGSDAGALCLSLCDIFPFSLLREKDSEATVNDCNCMKILNFQVRGFEEQNPCLINFIM